MNKKQNVFQICIQGYLDQEWLTWFNGCTIEHQENGRTMLTGAVTDQVALHAVLVKIRNLGLTLISLQMNDSQSCST